MHLPDKLLIDLDALVRQSLDDDLGRGVQAKAVEDTPNRSFLAGRAHAAFYHCCHPCIVPSPGLRLPESYLSRSAIESHHELR
jgi:hypothetical protein